jgi:hypothetical protein
MARLFLCFNPYEPTPIRAPLLTDWLEFALGGQQECVNKMVTMVSDLCLVGKDSRFIKWFAGGVGELKSRTRVGGARVYFFRVAEDAFVLARAECKNESVADQLLVDWTFEVAALFHQGVEVLL